MANAEHLERLKQGIEEWNYWREKNSGVQLDLVGASLIRAHLSRANLIGADLIGADLRIADLSHANLREADLSEVDLSYANLREANLVGANLRGTHLSRAYLRGADLREANLSEANLRGTHLREANLRRANLSRTQVLGTNFENAVLTGACIQDWNTNSTMNLKDVVCEHVYLNLKEGGLFETSYKERRPHSGSFQPGEFAALFQQAVDTVDLIFKDGIDWQAFFQSFQDLRSQYTNQALSIQAIEKKRGDAFVVRVEVAEGTNKKAIDVSAKELYETKLVLIEQRYRAELKAKDSEILVYKQQSASMESIAKLLANRPMTLEMPKMSLNSDQVKVLETIEGKVYEYSKIAEVLHQPVDVVKYFIEVMVAEGYLEGREAYRGGDHVYVYLELTSKGKTALIDQSKIIPSSFGGPKYDMRGAQIAGGIAETVQGDQIGGIINNYGPNTEDITRLLATLRDQAQTFPTDQKDDANDALDDLERDLAAEQPDQGRIGRRLKKLVALGAAIGTIASGAAAVSGDVSTFTGNVIELTEQLGIPVEQVPLPPSGTP